MYEHRRSPQCLWCRKRNLSKDGAGETGEDPIVHSYVGHIKYCVLYPPNNGKPWAYFKHDQICIFEKLTLAAMWTTDWKGTRENEDELLPREMMVACFRMMGLQMERCGETRIYLECKIKIST